MKTRLSLLFLITSIVSSTIGADAHVRVFSQDGSVLARACTYEKFVVRVPVEKAVATVEVDLVVPAGIVVFDTQPKPGWHADLEKRRGIVRRIRWSGGALQPQEFDEFGFLAATPKRATTIDWDADQIYADRSTVHWTGKPGSETPHSQTSILSDPKACARP